MNIRHLFKLKSYEKTIFVLRKHPIFLLRDALFWTMMAAVPVGVVFLLQNVRPTILTGEISFPVLAVAGAIYYLAIWLFFFSFALEYYLDIWVVTNDRIISVEQSGLFGRTISEMDLWLVQDVTSEVKGIMHTVFNYGDLHVQTAAEKARFLLEHVGNPSAIRQKILDLADEDRKYHVGNVQLKKVGL